MSELKRLAKYELWGAVFTIVMSVMLHFIYPLSKSPLAAVLGAANESVWEHTKILFLPYLLYAVFEWVVLRPSLVRFFVCKTAGLLFIDVAVIVFFYTYSGILGFHLVWLDILSAFAWAGLAHLISYKLYTSRLDLHRYLIPSAIASIMLIGAFLVFTWVQPRINLFLDSRGFYGPAR